MLLKHTIHAALLLGVASCCLAQEKTTSEPIELEALKAAAGVWDAEIEIWPQGPDSASLKLKGVETNRPYGEHWLASDFDSEFDGQTMKVHSIVGYDLDKQEMVGTVVDHGPYAASLTGRYDADSKTVHWVTKGKNIDGTPIVQKTSIAPKKPGRTSAHHDGAGRQKRRVHEIHANQVREAKLDRNYELSRDETRSWDVSNTQTDACGSATKAHSPSV